MLLIVVVEQPIWYWGSAIKAPHHNPLFDIDEEDMLNGIVALGTIATHYLK